MLGFHCFWNAYRFPPVISWGRCSLCISLMTSSGRHTSIYALSLAMLPDFLAPCRTLCNLQSQSRDDQSGHPETFLRSV